MSAGCAPEVQSSGEGLASTAAFAPGTYTASAPGKKGPVTVEVRMSESAIESVEIVEFEDTERISAPARERVPQQIVELQSLNVDTVTGATLTSICPLMYTNNPLTKSTPIATNSNKLRTYSVSRYYKDADILRVIAGEEVR